MAEIKKAKETDCQLLAENIRIEDCLEVKALTKVPVRLVATSMVRNSKEALSAYNRHGQLIAMFGVMPYSHLSDTGCPWLLTTNAIRKDPRPLLRNTPIYLEKWKKDYKLLENYVDARYRGALRWAKWAGFKIDPAIPFGEKSLLFHRISLEGEQ